MSQSDLFGHSSSDDDADDADDAEDCRMDLAAATPLLSSAGAGTGPGADTDSVSSVGDIDEDPLSGASALGTQEIDWEAHFHPLEEENAETTSTQDDTPVPPKLPPMGTDHLRPELMEVRGLTELGFSQCLKQQRNPVLPYTAAIFGSGLCMDYPQPCLLTSKSQLLTEREVFDAEYYVNNVVTVQEGEQKPAMTLDEYEEKRRELLSKNDSMLDLEQGRYDGAAEVCVNTILMENSTASISKRIVDDAMKAHRVSRSAFIEAPTHSSSTLYKTVHLEKNDVASLDYASVQALDTGLEVINEWELCVDERKGEIRQNLSSLENEFDTIKRNITSKERKGMLDVYVLTQLSRLERSSTSFTISSNWPKEMFTNKEKLEECSTQLIQAATQAQVDDSQPASNAIQALIESIQNASTNDAKKYASEPMIDTLKNYKNKVENELVDTPTKEKESAIKKLHIVKQDLMRCFEIYSNKNPVELDKMEKHVCEKVGKVISIWDTNSGDDRRNEFESFMRDLDADANPSEWNGDLDVNEASPSFHVKKLVLMQLLARQKHSDLWRQHDELVVCNRVNAHAESDETKAASFERFKTTFSEYINCPDLESAVQVFKEKLKSVLPTGVMQVCSFSLCHPGETLPVQGMMEADYVHHLGYAIVGDEEECEDERQKFSESVVEDAWSIYSNCDEDTNGVYNANSGIDIKNEKWNSQLAMEMRRLQEACTSAVSVDLASINMRFIGSLVNNWFLLSFQWSWAHRYVLDEIDAFKKSLNEKLSEVRDVLKTSLSPHRLAMIMLASNKELCVSELTNEKALRASFDEMFEDGGISLFSTKCIKEHDFTKLQPRERLILKVSFRIAKQMYLARTRPLNIGERESGDSKDPDKTTQDCKNAVEMLQNRVQVRLQTPSLFTMQDSEPSKINYSITDNSVVSVKGMKKLRVQKERSSKADCAKMEVQFMSSDFVNRDTSSSNEALDVLDVDFPISNDDIKELEDKHKSAHTAGTCTILIGNGGNLSGFLIRKGVFLKVGKMSESTSDEEWREAMVVGAESISSRSFMMHMYSERNKQMIVLNQLKYAPSRSEANTLRRSLQVAACVQVQYLTTGKRTAQPVNFNALAEIMRTKLKVDFKKLSIQSGEVYMAMPHQESKLWVQTQPERELKHFQIMSMFETTRWSSLLKSIISEMVQSIKDPTDLQLMEMLLVLSIVGGHLQKSVHDVIIRNTKSKKRGGEEGEEEASESAPPPPRRKRGRPRKEDAPALSLNGAPSSQNSFVSSSASDVGNPYASHAITNNDSENPDPDFIAFKNKHMRLLQSLVPDGQIDAVSMRLFNIHNLKVLKNQIAKMNVLDPNGLYKDVVMSLHSNTPTVPSSEFRKSVNPSGVIPIRVVDRYVKINLNNSKGRRLSISEIESKDLITAAYRCEVFPDNWDEIIRLFPYNELSCLDSARDPRLKSLISERIKQKIREWVKLFPAVFNDDDDIGYKAIIGRANQFLGKGTIRDYYANEVVAKAGLYAEARIVIMQGMKNNETGENSPNTGKSEYRSLMEAQCDRSVSEELFSMIPKGVLAEQGGKRGKKSRSDDTKMADPVMAGKNSSRHYGIDEWDFGTFLSETISKMIACKTPDPQYMLARFLNCNPDWVNISAAVTTILTNWDVKAPAAAMAKRILIFICKTVFTRGEVVYLLKKKFNEPLTEEEESHRPKDDMIKLFNMFYPHINVEDPIFSKKGTGDESNEEAERRFNLLAQFELLVTVAMAGYLNRYKKGKIPEFCNHTMTTINHWTQSQAEEQKLSSETHPGQAMLEAFLQCTSYRPGAVESGANVYKAIRAHMTENCRDESILTRFDDEVKSKYTTKFEEIRQKYIELHADKKANNLAPPETLAQLCYLEDMLVEHKQNNEPVFSTNSGSRRPVYQFNPFGMKRPTLKGQNGQPYYPPANSAKNTRLPVFGFELIKNVGKGKRPAEEAANPAKRKKPAPLQASASSSSLASGSEIPRPESSASAMDVM